MHISVTCILNAIPCMKAHKLLCLFWVKYHSGSTNQISVSPTEPSKSLATFKLNSFPPITISHCRQTCLSLVTNIFCAGDEHYWQWRRTCFTLETNTLVLEMSALKMLVRTSTTHTQLATSDFQTKLISRWSLVTATHLRALSRCGDPKGI